jgi:hypothetical protein
MAKRSIQQELSWAFSGNADRGRGLSPIFSAKADGQIGFFEYGFFDGRKFIPIFLTYQHHRFVTY